MTPLQTRRSSLSPCIHAAIAARIGRVDDALKYWRESLYFDLHNTMSNSQLGIHAAVLGGTWQTLVFHLLGVRLTESGCSFDHKAISLIPPEWRGLKLKLRYRNRSYFSTSQPEAPSRLTLKQTGRQHEPKAKYSRMYPS